MKSVALVLGALPPFEGPWVQISEGVVWDCCTITQPHGLDVNGQVKVEVNGMYWSTIRLDSENPNKKLMGQFARAVLTEKVDGVKSISVILEEAEDDD